MIYLGIPYTFNAEKSFKIANEVASVLMNEGEVVFSPISHSHPIADMLDESLRYDQEFWLKQDLAFLANCEKAAFVLIGGVNEGIDLLTKSKGCMTEFKYCISNDIPVSFYIYEED